MIFSSNGYFAVDWISTNKTSLYAWDPTGWKRLLRIQVGQDYCRTMAISNTGRLMAFCDAGMFRLGTVSSVFSETFREDHKDFKAIDISFTCDETCLIIIGRTPTDVTVYVHDIKRCLTVASDLDIFWVYLKGVKIRPNPVLPRFVAFEVDYNDTPGCTYCATISEGLQITILDPVNGKMDWSPDGDKFLHWDETSIGVYPLWTVLGLTNRVGTLYMWDEDRTVICRCGERECVKLHCDGLSRIHECYFVHPDTVLATMDGHTADGFLMPMRYAWWNITTKEIKLGDKNYVRHDSYTRLSPMHEVQDVNLPPLSDRRLTDLPPEVLAQISQHLSPMSFARFTSTCKAVHDTCGIDKAFEILSVKMWGPFMKLVKPKDMYWKAFYTARMTSNKNEAILHFSVHVEKRLSRRGPLSSK